MTADQDVGVPSGSPKPANEAEQRKVTEVREMQALVRQRAPEGKTTSKADMMAILNSFGADWSIKLPTYTLAINTMDQGVGP